MTRGHDRLDTAYGIGNVRQCILEERLRRPNSVTRALRNFEPEPERNQYAPHPLLTLRMQRAAINCRV